MGTTYRARLQQSIVSRRRTQCDFKKEKANQLRTISGSTSNDKTSKTTFDRSDVAGHYDRSVEETK